MAHDMVAARDLCYTAMSSFLRVWAFERTPPAPVSAQDAYLSAIERSDLVVWLVHARTPPAVQAEIELAVKLGRPILAFRLPADSRDEATTQLTATVREVAKTADVEDLDDLGTQLVQALSDVLAERFRAGSTSSRKVYLESLYGRLGGQAIARWQALGVTADRALGLLTEEGIGSLPGELLPASPGGLIVLQGDFGSGKSLAAIRWLRKRIETAVTDRRAPIPVWLDARTPFQTLDGALAQLAGSAGEYRSLGVSLVIDGIDERTDRPFASILDECRALVHALPNTAILMTTRPTTSFAADTELKTIPALTADEAAALINRIFGSSVSSSVFYGYDEPILDAIRRPLFAILVGRSIAAHDRVGRITTTSLIGDLVLRALQRDGEHAQTNDLLLKLASLSISADGKSIPVRDFGTQDEVRSVVRTRLVTEVDGSLAFALPVFREWFGARWIERASESISDVTRDERQLDRWRFAINVAAATMPRDRVDALMSAVTKRSPAFASLVVAESESQWRQSSTAALPTAMVLGRQYRNSVHEWLVGLGPLAEVLTPKLRPSLPQLGVRLAGQYFIAEWKETLGAGDPIIELPDTVSPFHPSLPGWSWTQISTASVDPLWPWAEARNEFQNQLAAIIEGRALIMLDGARRMELVWSAAIAISKRGEHDYRPIPTDALRAAVKSLALGSVIVFRKRLIPLDPLLKELEVSGHQIECPYEDRDGPMTGWVSGGFSPAALLVRTQAVYGVALGIYDEVVSAFFPTMRERLSLAALLPARLVGQLELEPDRSLPGLSYHFEPLATSTPNQVAIELGNDPADWEKVSTYTRMIRELRPEIGSWITGSSHSTVLEVFGATPATAIAFDWLAKDLLEYRWLERRPNRY